LSQFRERRVVIRRAIFGSRLTSALLSGEGSLSQRRSKGDWIPPGVCAVCMTSTTKRLLEQVESWPQEDQEEFAEYAREIEARRSGVYHATPEELAAIDEAIAELDRGEAASETEVRAAFAKFRGA
jgi:hypothetical protein